MRMKRPLLVVAALAAAVTASVRRKQAQHDTEVLWREATADASQ